MVKELGDRAALGRTYGNLGNVYYLLGDFQTAIAAHEKVSSKLLITLDKSFFKSFVVLVLFISLEISVLFTYIFS